VQGSSAGGLGLGCLSGHGAVAGPVEARHRGQAQPASAGLYASHRMTPSCAHPSLGRGFSPGISCQASARAFSNVWQSMGTGLEQPTRFAESTLITYLPGTSRVVPRKRAERWNKPCLKACH